MNDKIFFEMSDDEKVLNNLNNNVQFAATLITEGFSNSKLYDSDESQKLLDDLKDKLWEVSEIIEVLVSKFEQE